MQKSIKNILFEGFICNITYRNLGSTRVYCLGSKTSHSYNISSMFPSDYANINADNFLVVVSSGSFSGYSDHGDPSYIGAQRNISYINGSYSVVKKYSQGVFTASASVSGNSNINGNIWPVSGSSNLTSTVYLVIGEID